MSITLRIFLGIFCIVSVGLYALVGSLSEDVKIQYRESTEEPLVDASQIFAAIVSETIVDGEIDTTLLRDAFSEAYKRTFVAQIYNLRKTNVDFIVYVTDANGIVLFDSRNGLDEGKDYSGWRNIRLTLEGTYGARTSRDEIAAKGTSVLHISAPIIDNDRIVGSLTVGKPTHNASIFIQDAIKKIVLVSTLTGALIILVGIVLSHMITRPIRRLTDYAKAIRDGKRPTMPALGNSEIQELGQAFEEMRDAIEGKNYVENYVQALTHELKSPLAGIQGATELLKEGVPETASERFLQNIHAEADRMQNIIDTLLALASLEKQKELETIQRINIQELIEDILDTFGPTLSAKNIRVEVDCPPVISIEGDPFLVRQVFINILQNACDFSLRDTVITISVTKNSEAVHVVVTDEGVGIPQYATEKIFNRFYSLQRPDSGKKSSGLGLSFVREALSLHSGHLTISNREARGVAVKLFFPHGSGVK